MYWGYIVLRSIEGPPPPYYFNLATPGITLVIFKASLMTLRIAKFKFSSKGNAFFDRDVITATRKWVH